jgi:PTH1 family peptidyl-tRNA hydrolase
LTRLVIGLGNPGPEHEWTPHNLGFHVVERIAAAEGSIFEPAAALEGWNGPRGFDWARLPERDALLVKPLTFMNRSGTVVAPLARHCAAAPEEVFAVFDDIDLPLGTLRIRPHGGTGGHRGVQSIVTELGTDRFPRLRIGVGRPRTDAARHVLSRFSERERELAEVLVVEAAEAVLFWLREGDLERCMTRFHSRWTPEGDKGARTKEST